MVNAGLDPDPDPDLGDHADSNTTVNPKTVMNRTVPRGTHLGFDKRIKGAKYI